ncbi:hypothetical protein BsWGS_07974 [Bradybaena similaris]
MPAPAPLLRLDSVGEVVSTIKLPSDTTSSNNKVSSKPTLHNSRSFDSDIAPKTTRLFSSPKMAKFLSPNKAFRNFPAPGSVQIESHNFGHRSQPEDGGFYGMKPFSSSFDSCQKYPPLRNMNTILMPSGRNGYNLFGTQGHQQFKDLESILHPAVSRSLSSPISIAAACHTSSPGCFVSPSVLPTPPCKGRSECLAVPPQIPVADLVCQNCESNVAPLSSSLGKFASHHSSSSEADDSSISSVVTPEHDLTLESVFNGECKQTDSSRNCDKLKCDNSQNSSSNSSNGCLTSSADLSSVLSTPRKITKKGRPSSKKQRKRQREKQKTCSVPLAKSSSNDAEGVPHLSNGSQSEETDSSSILFEASCSQSMGSIPKESTPVKSQSIRCPIASFFFGGRSDSEDSEDDSDYSDICEDGDEWQVSLDEKMHAVPKKCAGFNAPLNLDSVFKRKSVPTLKSVFWTEESESESEASAAASHSNHLGSTVDISKDDHSVDSSVEFSSPMSSPSKFFGFTCGLSIEALFTKKPDLVCTAAAKESAFNTVDGASSNVESCQMPTTSFEMYCESISKINAKWNENYPSAGFRSCLAISSDEINDPSVKVHFASGPSFLTVHFVGTEERAGTWHHFSLDRERFQRRILDLDSILAPVLDADHRAKVLKRNQT